MAGRSSTRQTRERADGRENGGVSYVIKSLPQHERPRERLERHGPGALTTAELLAIVWRTGTPGENVLQLAGRAVSAFGGLAGLSRAGLADLGALKGVGQVKAIELQAAIELGRRLLTTQPDEKPVIRSPLDVANILMLEMGLLDRETLRVVLLDTKNRVQSIPQVYQGSLNSSPVRVSELFREAVRQNSASIIVVHNHPSGDPAPSPEDVRVTSEAVQAGRLLDIEVLDHLVIGHGRFVSLKERGLGFSESVGPQLAAASPRSTRPT